MPKMKPMQAKTLKDPETLTYPVLGSPKLDGIRALVKKNEDLVSRKLKLIPNKRLQEVFGLSTLAGYDGELIMGDPTQPGCWNRTDSVVMSHEHPDSDKVRFYVFDRWLPNTKNWPYERRAPRNSHRHPRVVLVPQVLIRSPDELRRFHRRLVDKGYEGSMYRDPLGPYEYRRSWFLLKFKDIESAEGVIVGFKREKENRNPQKMNELGRMSRSSHKAGKVLKRQVGAVQVKMLNGTFKGVTCWVGTGIGDELGKDMYRYPHKYLGQKATIDYRVEKGADKPWNARWKGLRND